MSGLLQGRVVIVTGGAGEGSIGEAIATRCAGEGARVIVTSRSEPSALQAAKRLGASVSGRACDLTSGASVARFVERVLEEHRQIDGVVHNAGHPIQDWTRSFQRVEIEEYAKVFEVDVLGALRLSKAVLPGMVERRRGSLVFTSSTAAIGGYQFLHEFAPSKAGVLGAMRGLAAEMGAHGVRANAVAYGNIASPNTTGALSAAEKDALARESPMGRWGTPDEAAGASVFLLSDLASFVNGQTLIVDGGTVMR